MYVAHTGADRVDVHRLRAATASCARCPTSPASPASCRRGARPALHLATAAVPGSASSAARTRSCSAGSRSARTRTGSPTTARGGACTASTSASRSARAAPPRSSTSTALTVVAELPLPGRPRWAVYDEERRRRLREHPRARRDRRHRLRTGRDREGIRRFRATARTGSGSTAPALLRRRRRRSSSSSTATPGPCSRSCRCRASPTSSCTTPSFAASTSRSAIPASSARSRHEATLTQRGDGRDRGRRAHDRLGSRRAACYVFCPGSGGAAVYARRSRPEHRRARDHRRSRRARAVAYGLGSVLIGESRSPSRGLSGAAVGGVLASLLGRSAHRLGPARPLRRPHRPAALLPGPVRRDGGCRHRLRAHRLAARAVLAALTGTRLDRRRRVGAVHLARAGDAPARRARTRRGSSAPTTPSRRSPARLGALIALVGSSPRWLLAYPVAAAAGLLATARLSPAVERAASSRPSRGRRSTARAGSSAASPRSSRSTASAAGFVPQTFIAYLFTRKYGASPQTLAIVFFSIGILQALSFQVAVRLAGRFGLLRTMVFSTCPRTCSCGVAFAPNLADRDRAPARPLRALPDGRPDPAGIRRRRRRPERATAAAAYTNTARYVTRPSRRSSPVRRREPASARRSCSPARSRSSTTSASTSASGTSRVSPPR